MKFITSFLETMGYIFKLAAICAIESSLSTIGDSWLTAVMGVVVLAGGLWLIGWGIHFLEFKLEKSREYVVKHRDYYVLATCGILLIFTAIVAAISNPDSFSLTSVLVALYLCVAAYFRMLHYEKEGISIEEL